MDLTGLSTLQTLTSTDNLLTINPFALLVASSPSQDATPSPALSFDSTLLSGESQLLGALSSYQTTLDALAAPGGVGGASVISTNPQVASGVSLPSASSGQYAVTVQALAQPQVVESAALPDATAPVGSGTVTIQGGHYDATTNTFTPNDTPAVSLSITNGSLSDIAGAINGAGAGVTASIIQDPTGSRLLLMGAATGSANGFAVTVQDVDGTNTDLTGLSQLAFDPTAAAGAGQNLGLTQAAGDASMVANGATLTNPTNTGIPVVPGVTATVTQLGNTTLTVGPTATTVQANAQQLVDGFNAVATTLQSLTAPNQSLSGDSVAQGLQFDLQGTLTALGLSQLGIQLQSSGQLTLDPVAFQNAYADNPTSTVAALTQAAQTLDGLVQGYANPDGILGTVLQGLQQGLGALPAGFNDPLATDTSSALLANPVLAQALLTSTVDQTLLGDTVGSASWLPSPSVSHYV